jgi:hypothetical protein
MTEKDLLDIMIHITVIIGLAATFIPGLIMSTITFILMTEKHTFEEIMPTLFWSVVSWCMFIFIIILATE